MSDAQSTPEATRGASGGGVSQFIDEAAIHDHVRLAESIGEETAWQHLRAFVDAQNGHAGDVAAAKIDFKALVHRARLNGTVFPEEDAPIGWSPVPVGELPSALRDHALAHAEAIGCDAALIVLPMLAAVSAAIGNSACIGLDHTWKEPPTLWTCVVAPSGSAKSPAQDAALQPTLDIERDAAAKYAKQLEEYRLDLAQWKGRQGGKSNSGDPAPTPPQQDRYRVGDVTAETLLAVHAANPRGLLLLRDELAGWLSGFDRYAKSGKGDAQTWIETYGARPVTVDRKSNAENPVLYVDRPSVAIAGGIQPGILARTLRGEHFDSGFAARLLMAWPPSRIIHWKPTTHGAVREVDEAYQKVIAALYGQPFAVKETRTVPTVIPLSDRAIRAFQAFHAWASSKTARLPEMSPLRAVWSKAPALCARLALCIELAERAQNARFGEVFVTSDTEITLLSIERAGRLTRWFLRESLRIYRRLELGTEAMSAEDTKLRHLPESFTRDDVAKVWGFKDASSASKKIKGLMQASKVSKTGHGTYRRPTEGDGLTGSLTDLELLSEAQPLPSAYLPGHSGDGLASPPPHL